MIKSWYWVKDRVHLGYLYVAAFGLIAAQADGFWVGFNIAFAVILFLMYEVPSRRRRKVEKAIAKAEILAPPTPASDAATLGYVNLRAERKYRDAIAEAEVLPPTSLNSTGLWKVNATHPYGAWEPVETPVETPTDD